MQADEERQRAGLADALRAERAEWLRQALPDMTVADMRRILQSSGQELGMYVSTTEEALHRCV